MTTDLCNRPVFPDRECGKKTGHRGNCESAEALARAKKNSPNRPRKQKIPLPRQHVQANMLIPTDLLPGSALASMASYRQSGLYKPGDTLYEKIVRRLVERELKKND